MTGKHGHTTGLVGNSHGIKPMATNPTLPGLLTAHGYQTRAQGKMHFAPTRCHYGFEYMELSMEYYRERRRDPANGVPKWPGFHSTVVESDVLHSGG